MHLFNLLGFSFLELVLGLTIKPLLRISVGRAWATAFTKIFSTSSVDAFTSMAIRTSYSSIAQFYYRKKSAYSFVMWIRTGLGGKAVGGVGAIWLHYYFGRKSTVDKMAWGDNRLDNSQCW